MVVIFVVAGKHFFCFGAGIIGNCVAYSIIISMLVDERIDEYVSSSFFLGFRLSICSRVCISTSIALIARSHCLKRLRTSFIAAGSMRITLYNPVIEQTLHAGEKQQGPSAC